MNEHILQGLHTALLPVLSMCKPLCGDDRAARGRECEEPARCGLVDVEGSQPGAALPDTRSACCRAQCPVVNALCLQPSYADEEPTTLHAVKPHITEAYFVRLSTVLLLLTGAVVRWIHILRAAA